MASWDGYARFCSLSRGLDVVGERWTLVIIQELLHRPRRYSELRSLLPGIGSNVLSARLRSLEARGVVERIAGGVGQGVVYALTDRGRSLGPALALFREWGLDELLPPIGAGAELPIVHDLSYAVPADLDLHESYEWQIDDDRYSLTINGQQLVVDRGRANKPVVVVRTTRAFMREWVAGSASWDSGRSSGDVTVEGSDDAWNRMLLATAYPGRAADIVEQVRETRTSPKKRSGRKAAPTGLRA